MKKKHVVLSVVAILAVAGGAFAYSKRGPKPTEIEIAKVGREDLQAKVTANGKIQATKKVDISATIPGQVVQLAVREGDRCQKGPVPAAARRGQLPRRARSYEFSMQALLKDLRLRPAQRSSRPSRTCTAPRRTTPPGSFAEADLQRARTTVVHREAAPCAPSQRVRAGAGDARGRAGLAVQDDDPLADGRHRDREADRGGRGRGDRRPEPARARCCSPSPTCRSSRPRWRSTRPRSRR